MKCSNCENIVNSSPPLTGAYKPEGLLNKIGGKGYFCPSCDKGFCSKCCMAAAKKTSQGGYTCPECHSLIGDNPWV